MGDGKGQPKLGQRCRHALLVLRIGEGEQERESDRFRPRGFDPGGKVFKFAGSGRAQDVAVLVGTLRHSKAQIRRHQRLDRVKEEVIELGTSLPPDLDGILKSRRRYKGYAGSLALQQ